MSVQESEPISLRSTCTVIRSQESYAVLRVDSRSCVSF